MLEIIRQILGLPPEAIATIFTAISTVGGAGWIANDRLNRQQIDSLRALNDLLREREKNAKDELKKMEENLSKNQSEMIVQRTELETKISTLQKTLASLPSGSEFKDEAKEVQEAFIDLNRAQEKVTDAYNGITGWITSFLDSSLAPQNENENK